MENDKLSRRERRERRKAMSSAEALASMERSLRRIADSLERLEDIIVQRREPYAGGGHTLPTSAIEPLFNLEMDDEIPF